jgi:hypothetical protein
MIKRLMKLLGYMPVKQHEQAVDFLTQRATDFRKMHQDAVARLHAITSERDDAVTTRNCIRHELLRAVDGGVTMLRVRGREHADLRVAIAEPVLRYESYRTPTDTVRELTVHLQHAVFAVPVHKPLLSRLAQDELLRVLVHQAGSAVRKFVIEHGEAAIKSGEIQL